MKEQESSEAQTKTATQSVLRCLVPARYSAWLSGDLGARLVRDLHRAVLEVSPVPELVVRRIASGVLVQGDEDPGPFVGSLAAALVAVEQDMAQRYPVMHAELGSVFTGSLQVVLSNPEFRRGPSGAGAGGPPRPGR